MKVIANYDETLFKPRYLRNNKGGGMKNLRCFPQCSPLHQDKGFCGTSLTINLLIQQSAIPAAYRNQLASTCRFYSEFVRLKDETLSDRFIPGESKLANDALQAMERTPKTPTNPLFKGTIVPDSVCSKVVDGVSYISLDVSFNKEKRAWHYGWNSNKHTCRDDHSLRLYVFVEEKVLQHQRHNSPAPSLAEVDKSRFVLVNRFDSPRFIIYCKKRGRRTPGNKATSMVGSPIKPNYVGNHPLHTSVKPFNPATMGRSAAPQHHLHHHQPRHSSPLAKSMYTSQQPTAAAPQQQHQAATTGGLSIRIPSMTDVFSLKGLGSTASTTATTTTSNATTTPGNKRAVPPGANQDWAVKKLKRNDSLMLGPLTPTGTPGFSNKFFKDDWSMPRLLRANSQKVLFQNGLPKLDSFYGIGSPGGRQQSPNSTAFTGFLDEGEATTDSFADMFKDNDSLKQQFLQRSASFKSAAFTPTVSDELFASWEQAHSLFREDSVANLTTFLKEDEKSTVQAASS